MLHQKVDVVEHEDGKYPVILSSREIEETRERERQSHSQRVMKICR